MSESLKFFEEVMAESTPTISRKLAAVAQIDPGAWSPERIEEHIIELVLKMGVFESGDQFVEHFFSELEFTPNVRHYYAPENSLIHHVLERRRAIPLTLAILAREVGWQLGVHLTVVGMPGHALIGDGLTHDRWYDPFAGGRRLEREDCEQIFHRLSPGAAFTDQMLAPLSERAMITRMLANLQGAYLKQGNIGQVAAVLERLIRVPGSSIRHRVELAGVLNALGRDDQAAEQHDALAELNPKKAAQHRAAAARHRARRN